MNLINQATIVFLQAMPDGTYINVFAESNSVTTNMLSKDNHKSERYFRKNNQSTTRYIFVDFNDFVFWLLFLSNF